MLNMNSVFGLDQNTASLHIHVWQGPKYIFDLNLSHAGNTSFAYIQQIPLTNLLLTLNIYSFERKLKVTHNLVKHL